MAMANNTSLTLSGQIVHRGDLAITAGGNATDLIVDSILNLQGGGTISMLSNNARLRGAGVFVNQDHLIQGAGQIGVNQSAGTNAAGAVIHALTAGGTMTIDPNAFLGFVNDGILRASSGGSLHLSGNAGGQFTNGDTGVIEALDGGTVSHGSSAFLTNLRDGKLAGGTYRVIDGGNGASLSLPGGNITANAADIELSGAGAQFAQLASLATNEGSLSVANGASLQTTGDLTLTGSSSLDVDIAGKPNDTGLWGRIVAAGKSVLGGVLNVSVNIGNTFAAALGDVWKIISGSIREGVFADVNITTGDLPAGSRIEVEYVADGVQVAVVPAVAALLAAPTYQSWAAALDPDVDSDPSADSDGDGATNLEEYAFGMDPSQPDPWRTPVPHIDRASGQSFAALTYSFPSGVDYPSDVVYTVERSNDLRSWTSAGISAGDHEILDGTGRESTTFRCEDAMDGTAAPVFLRVSVHLQDQVAEAK
jgi:hypothetical protein